VETNILNAIKEKITSLKFQKIVIWFLHLEPTIHIFHHKNKCILVIAESTDIAKDVQRHANKMFNTKRSNSN